MSIPLMPGLHSHWGQSLRLGELGTRRGTCECGHSHSCARATGQSLPVQLQKNHDTAESLPRKFKKKIAIKDTR